MPKTDYDRAVTQVKRRTRGTNREKSTALYESLKERGTAVEPGTTSDSIIEQFKAQEDASMDKQAQELTKQPTSGEDEGYYVKVTYNKYGIQLSGTENLKKAVAKDQSGEFAHDRQLDDIWSLMEDLFSNGWEHVYPEDIGALTDGEIFSDPNGNVYWHERYPIEDAAEELRKGGTVDMQYGGNLFEDEEKIEPNPDQMELPMTSSKKQATGEMSQAEADDPEAWPMHHAIADALGGKVKAFDQYQGPYILIGSEVRGRGVYAPAIPMKGTVRLWIQTVGEGEELQVYNEDNEKLSQTFFWDDNEAAIEAAKEVLGTEETKESSEKTAAPPHGGEQQGGYGNHPVVEMLWDSLKRDPSNKDRVQTGWGTKTKQGLVLSVARALKDSPVKEASKKAAKGPVDESGRPIAGRERYPEFKPLVDKVVALTIRAIQADADKIESEMPYKQQFVLEEVINQLKERV
jgi:hypothetical protein